MARQELTSPHRAFAFSLELEQPKSSTSGRDIQAVGMGSNDRARRLKDLTIKRG